MLTVNKWGGQVGETLLSVKGLKTYFISRDAEVRAVDGIDFEVSSGQIVCIVGESGCGKSMTSFSIMGLVPKPKGKIAGGEIIFEGKNLLDLSNNELANIRGNEISMIFQEPMTALNPVITIGKQITETLRRHQKISKKEALEKAIGILKFVGVPRAEEIVKEYPHQLSGGLRQRVMIGMAMICNPKLLIADEPTTALDVTIQAQVLELMKKMRDERGTAIILITHDLGVVSDMADQVVVMYAGQVVEKADADELFNNPQHPYTKGLLASIPSLEEKKETLYSIPGTVPNASAYPVGCRFAKRCPVAQQGCFEKQPELRAINAEHLVRCDLI